MSVSVMPVSFLNQAGRRLFGILHLPVEKRVDGGAILLLSPGVKMRVGPHRLYKMMAEEFASLGYPVLRFDFEGLGDSEGEVSETLLTNLYGTIQRGRYVGDTVAAMDWMQEAYGVTGFTLAGLCGGAITGLLTAASDPRVTSLLGLAIPVVVEGSQTDPIQHMTMGELGGIRKGYVEKLRLHRAEGWKSLWRFVTLQSHYSLIWRSLIAPLSRQLKRDSVNPERPLPVDDNANPAFPPALFHMLSTSRRVLLVFAGSDRLHWEFEEKFASRHRAQLGRAAGCTIHVTPFANHIFSLPEWQSDMMRVCRRWLSGMPAEVTAGSA